MLDWFFGLLTQAPDPPQTTFAFCPHCRTELVAAPDVPCTIEDSGRVRYDCWCRTTSWWDFSAPAPICVEHTL